MNRKIILAVFTACLGVSASTPLTAAEQLSGRSLSSSQIVPFSTLIPSGISTERAALWAAGGAAAGAATVLGYTAWYNQNRRERTRTMRQVREALGGLNRTVGSETNPYVLRRLHTRRLRVRDIPPSAEQQARRERELAAGTAREKAAIAAQCDGINEMLTDPSNPDFYLHVGLGDGILPKLRDRSWLFQYNLGDKIDAQTLLAPVPQETSSLMNLRNQLHDTRQGLARMLKGKNKEETTLECPVCYTPEQLRMLACKHPLCTDCMPQIKKALADTIAGHHRRGEPGQANHLEKRGPACPTCREPFATEDMKNENE